MRDPERPCKFSSSGGGQFNRQAVVIARPLQFVPEAGQLHAGNFGFHYLSTAGQGLDLDFTILGPGERDGIQQANCAW